MKPFQKSDLIPAIEVALGRFAEIVALEREIADLAERLEARKIIDRAKGRLMDEHGLTEARRRGGSSRQRRWTDAGRKIARDRPATSSTASSLPERREPDARPGRSHAPAYDRAVRCPKLLLLDGHSLAYRAFSRSPPTSRRRRGTVTNAVYGFTSMLVKVLADEQPDHIAVAFDAPGAARSATSWTPSTRPAARRRPTCSGRSSR